MLYRLSADAAKADRAEELLAIGGTISVQVLNQFVVVASRKLRMTWTEIREVPAQIRAVCVVEPITIQTHERALHTAQRYGLSIYAALIVAAALLAGCRTLHSEDMQDGQVIDRRLTMRNPFAPSWRARRSTRLQRAAKRMADATPMRANADRWSAVEPVVIVLARR